MTKPKIYTVAHPDELSPPLKGTGFCVDVVLASEYAQLEQQLAAVTAENVELKSDRDTLAKYWVDDGGDEDCAKSYCEEIPATNAALNEIRAQGVEMLADRLQQLLVDGNFAGDEIAVIAGAIHCGRDIAQQLRGEDSK